MAMKRMKPSWHRLYCRTVDDCLMCQFLNQLGWWLVNFKALEDEI
jgi:hypothetical protein